MRRTTFHEGGRPHQLIVIGDLSQTLREEEFKAWQRLVRVLGHELNNSLATIKSLAGSLGDILKSEKRAPDWEDDMRSGLVIIEFRAGSLGRFMQVYARLAKLPAPVLNPCYIPALINRVVTLESRLPVKITGGPEISVGCDEAQIKEVLINLIKNAVEAAFENREDGKTEADVHVGWSRQGHILDISVVDGGHGIANDNNLFVPFFLRPNPPARVSTSCSVDKSLKITAAQ